MLRSLLFAFALADSLPLVAQAQETGEPLQLPQREERLHYHTAPPGAGARFARQHEFTLPSVLFDDDDTEIITAEGWLERRRPQLVEHWTRILGKLEPEESDAHWFGDISQARIHEREEKEGYTRIDLSIPIEVDFWQPHLLLLPRGQGDGPFPAVIAWTSTTPDYKKPEEWWGAWLAQHGYVVLTGWSFIRNYRDDTSYRNGASKKVYERFGHWLPMAKMIHDVDREISFLRSRPEVDASSIGFMGFSLGAKAALYVAAFVSDVKATVAIDPHIALHGATNWHDPWYLDWKRQFPSIDTPDYPDPTLRGTPLSLLDVDPDRPGFERNHHELMALCAPRAFMLIGGSMDQDSAAHSDDRQSWAYFNRAKEVYDLLGLPERLELVATSEGHRATSPDIDAAWQRFFESWLKEP